jgi:hypothetical protein
MFCYLTPKQMVILAFVCLAILANSTLAQKRASTIQKNPRQITQPKPRETNNIGYIVDERLAVLRLEPSLYSLPLQRMRRGRELMITGSKQADGVTFYRVTVTKNTQGWMQSDAVVTTFKRNDDARLANLIHASNGFDQIERAVLFLDIYKKSAFRPAILLLLGDLADENAQRISAEANRRLDRDEMLASGAPIHSFFLNYTSLDRYKKLGINFVFNPETKKFYYDGASWKEIMQRFPKNNEAEEAKKRLEMLTEKLKLTK